MSTAANTQSADPRTAPSREQRTPSALRGVLSLARAELTLLLRNRTAIFNTMLIPLVLVVALYFIGVPSDAGPGNLLVITASVMAMAYIVYYNLVTTYVARRESYVLKRMRTGTVSDLGILVAAALPSIVLALLQISIVVLGAFVIGSPPSLNNALAVVVGVVLGFIAFAGLAAASTPITKTAETAQVTTLPVVMISMGLSGMFFSLSILPDTLETIARFTPGAAVVELLQTGLSGIDRYGNVIAGFPEALAAMTRPTLVLLMWVAITFALVRDRFAWEPRR
ncbi:ABC transporter permease [Epidermidibacterium keratini]|uniref:ABC transporter permease n=1 Tax=Epidermidibacterium keratini TaxID=1891644 RepID=A0A7L4YMY3_9ACTN|nr:ABC transporter permease [Epidermidibacterium keratini]QHC00510.1 ABC transporter permease [Epidermidibacterium keratini]